jgi:hypothetical protein
MKATNTTPNEEREECQVCVSNFTRIKKPIKCPNPTCNFTACSACYKQFINDNPNTLARCMEPSCKTHFSRAFIHDNFTKTFLKNEYTSHLKEYYFQKEQARLPETQELIVRKENHIKREEELKQMTIVYPENINYHLLYRFYVEIRRYDSYIDRENEPTIILDEVQCYEFVQHYIEYGRLPEYTAQTGQHQQPKKYEHQFHGKCPSSECRGLITDDHTCGICKTKVCPDCLIQINQSESHNCNPSTVESVKAISKDTKPCPTCKVPIYKIDGCSQMWCVQCHTAFCWNTGEIETQIHNPHYYEWMRQQKKEIPTLPNPAPTPYDDTDPLPPPPRLYRHFGNTTPSRIQTLITDKFTTMKYNIAFHVYPTLTQLISDEQLEQMIGMYFALCQYVTHLTHNNNNITVENDFEKETAKHRESYLRGNVDESSYKIILSSVYKEREFNQLFNQIIHEMFVEKVKRIFENYLYDLSQNIHPTNLQSIILEYNQQLKDAMKETESEIDKLTNVYGYRGQYKFLYGKSTIILISTITFGRMTAPQKKTYKSAVELL